MYLLRPNVANRKPDDENTSQLREMLVGGQVRARRRLPDAVLQKRSVVLT
jgi:hypothetical protein